MIATIAARYAELRSLDPACRLFGASGHRYFSSKAPLSEVLRLEAAIGTELPAEYREFLLQIGSGMGPGYGLLSPADVMVASSFQHVSIECNLDRFEDSRIVLRDFGSLTAAHVCRFITDHRTKAPDCLGQAGLLFRKPDGVIVISDDGCTSHHGMVTDGELRGTVWDVNGDVLLTAIPEGVIALAGAELELLAGSVIRRVGGTVQYSDCPAGFFQWVLDWAETAIAAIRSAQHFS